MRFIGRLSGWKPGASGGQLLVVAPLLAGSCYFVFHEMLQYWFTGVDAFPIILSSRLESIWEIPEIFFRDHLSAYVSEDIAAAADLRPVNTLAFAWDYWIWGMNPFGYHLTNLAIHFLNSILVFSLVRQLKLNDGFLVGMLAALLFSAHPLHSRTVPVIPVRADMLLCTFTLVSLIFALRYLDSSREPHWILALLFCSLALATKGTAIVVLALLFVTVCFVVRCARRPLVSAFIPVVSLVLLFSVYATYRFWTLGGLGGYAVLEGSNVYALIRGPRLFFELLAYPIPYLDFGDIAFVGPCIIVASAATLLGFTLVGSAHYLGGWNPRGWSTIERRLPDAQPLVLVSCWLFVFGALYTTIYMLSGVFQPWYLYSTLPFFCIILVAMALRSMRALVAAWPRPAKALVGAGLLAVFPSVLLALLIVGTPAVRGLDEWAATSRLSREYLIKLWSGVESLPDNSTVFLVNLPHGIECRGACVALSTVFEDYSIDSWIRLTAPEREFRFVAVSSIWLDETPVDSRTTFDPREQVIVVRNSAGSIERPWNTRSGDFFVTEIAPDPRRTRIAREGPPVETMTIRSLGERVTSEGYYFFNFLEVESMFRVRRTDLQRLARGDASGRQ